MTKLSTLRWVDETLVPTSPPPTPAVSPRLWPWYVFVAAWCGFLFFYGLNAGDLWRTESLRAIIAAEFLRSGNWIVPTLYGEALFTKPPGMYAAIALLSLPFGAVGDVTARLPSALAGLGTLLLMAWYFRRTLGNLAGLLAVVLLPMSLMWLDKAAAAEIDMLQVFWVTSAIVCFLRALEITEEDEAARARARPHYRGWRVQQGERGSYDFAEIDASYPSSATRHPAPAAVWRWWFAALLCVAGGVLTKWTAPAFFYLTVVSLLWWRGKLRYLWSKPHLVSAAFACSLCLAWVVAAVALSGWGTFFATVWREGWARVYPAHYERVYPWHEVPVHPFLLLIANLPGALLAPVALLPSFAKLWDEKGRRLLQALHCWTWPNVIFWSFIAEHTPRHSFPLFPGMTGLAVMVWLALLTGKLRWPVPRVRPRQILIGAVVLWLAAKLTFVHAVTPRRNGDRLPRAKAAEIARLVPERVTLFLFRLKDEGIMFYYSNLRPLLTMPVRRLPSPSDLPSCAEPVYCILTEPEWLQWGSDRPAELLMRLTDEQGASIVLVRVRG
jgi:4-amino-4-deoxy-L-arabinose transferase-like glycosyltransferase